jgi:hypothetical protein
MTKNSTERYVILEAPHIAHSSPVAVLLIAALVLTTSPRALRADDALTTEPRKELAKSGGDAVARVCTLANCATVLSIRRPDTFESAPSIPVQGPLRRNPPFGPHDPHVPPINQPSFMVQRLVDIWLIEVQRRDGTVEVIRQSYPALFQVGDEVLVEGDHVRAPE